MDILSAIDSEIARLQQVRALLANAGDGTVAAVTRRGRKPGKAPAKAPTKAAKKKRNLSPEGRARIAAAVKARWAKQKKAAKAA